MKMEWIGFILFIFSALIHFLFFFMESFLLQSPRGAQIFKLSETEHRSIKIWAFNQGFYNLFLAIGMCLGLYFVLIGRRENAGLMVGFSGLSMILAGLVLFFSSTKFRKGALLQIAPPFLGFLFLALHILKT